MHGCGVFSPIILFEYEISFSVLVKGTTYLSISACLMRKRAVRIAVSFWHDDGSVD